MVLLGLAAGLLALGESTSLGVRTGPMFMETLAHSVVRLVTVAVSLAALGRLAEAVVGIGLVGDNDKKVVLVVDCSIFGRWVWIRTGPASRKHRGLGIIVRV